MNLILQSDPGLTPAINRYGCRFRSLLAIGEFHTGRCLTATAIQQAYNELVPAAMNVNCLCNENEHKITRWAMRALGSAARCYQIGSVYGCAKLEFWPAAQIYTIKKGLTHFVGEAGYEHDPGFHFRLGDRMARLIFDPQPMAVIKEEMEVLIYQIVDGR